MPIIPIDDPADPRIEPYRDIRERDLVGRDGLFVAEGRVVIEKLAVSSAHRAQSLLIAGHRIGSMADVLARIDDETPVFAASQKVVDTVAGFPLHRGLLAIGRRTDIPTAEQPSPLCRTAPTSSCLSASPTTTTWAGYSETPRLSA